MRNRTIALAGKLGNAIPISTIESQSSDIRNVVCQVEVIPTPKNSTQSQTAITPQQNQQEVISLSSSVECVEIQLESDTPENIRARSEQKDDVHMSPKQTDNQTESTMQAASQQRAMSTRNVLDRPPQATTPDASFIKNFDSAMKLLKEIFSPIKKSMTFRREKENTSTSSVNKTPSSSNVSNQETTSTGDKSIKKM